MTYEAEPPAALATKLLDQFAQLAFHQRLRDLAPLMLQGIVDLTGAKAGYFLLYREAEGTLSVEASCGDTLVPGEWSAHVDATSMLATLAHPVFLSEDASASEESSLLMRTLEFLPRLRANWLVPLTLHERLVAVVALQVDDPIREEMLPLLHRLTAFAAGILINTIREQRLEESFDCFCEALGHMIDSRTRADETHSRRVGEYGEMTAAQLGWHPDDVEAARRAGYLHDIGKLCIPDEIIHKPSRLTEEEYEQMRKSVVWGASVIEGIPALGRVAVMIRHQGEKFDGSGYPDGLQGEAIPAGARVLAVSHRFAVALMPRADRAPIVRMRQVLGILERESGTALDPRIVEAFMEALGHTK